MNGEAEVIYTGGGYYQIPIGGRVYSLQYGDTARVPLYECRRLMKMGLFTANTSTWKTILETGNYCDPANIEGLLKGQKCFLIAGGPSLKGFDFSKLDNYFTVAINHSLRFYPQAKANLFIDTEYVKVERFLIQNYKGLIFGSFRCIDELDTAGKKNIYIFSQNTKFVGRSLNEGLYCGHGTTLSGLAAINLALIMEAEEIYLLGYDMKYSSSDHHWYGSLDERQDKYREELFTKKIPFFDSYKIFGNIFNCNPDSAIKAFPFMDINTAIGPKKGKVHCRVPVISSMTKPKAAVLSYPSDKNGNRIFLTSSKKKLSSINGMWNGQRCFVIGAGPSLKGFDFNRLDEENTITANHMVSYYKKTKIALLGDTTMLRYVGELIDNEFAGKVLASFHINSEDREKRENYFVYPKNFDHVSQSMEDGLFPDFNSGLEALNLALITGAHKIYLLGIDFCASSDMGEYYCFGKPDWFNYDIKQCDSMFDSRLPAILPFKKYRDRIFNCSPISKIKIFDFANIEEVLDGSK